MYVKILKNMSSNDYIFRICSNVNFLKRRFSQTDHKNTDKMIH